MTDGKTHKKINKSENNTECCGVRKIYALLAATPSSQRTTQNKQSWKSASQAPYVQSISGVVRDTYTSGRFALFLYGTATQIAFTQRTGRGESVLRCVDVGAEAVHCAGIPHSMLCVSSPTAIDRTSTLALPSSVSWLQFRTVSLTFAVSAPSLNPPNTQRVDAKHEPFDQGVVSKIKNINDARLRSACPRRQRRKSQRECVCVR